MIFPFVPNEVHRRRNHLPPAQNSWSGQGWWSLTAGGSTSGAVRGVPFFAGDAYLVRSVGNLVKLSPAEHQKRNRFVRGFFGWEYKSPLGKVFEEGGAESLTKPLHKKADGRLF